MLFTARKRGPPNTVPLAEVKVEPKPRQIPQESEDTTSASDKPSCQEPVVDEELAEVAPVCPPAPMEGVPGLPSRVKSEPSRLHMMADKQDTPEKKLDRCTTI